MDVGEWLAPKQRRTPAVIVSVAHLDDEELALVLGVLLEELLSWVRTLPGSQRLRALVIVSGVTERRAWICRHRWEHIEGPPCDQRWLLQAMTLNIRRFT